jgi:hypothetical protein
VQAGQVDGLKISLQSRLDALGGIIPQRPGGRMVYCSRRQAGPDGSGGVMQIHASAFRGIMIAMLRKAGERYD